MGEIPDTQDLRDRALFGDILSLRYSKLYAKSVLRRVGIETYDYSEILALYYIGWFENDMAVHPKIDHGWRW